MNWAELSYELGRVVLIRDFPGPSCPGPSCLWAELSVIPPVVPIANTCSIGYPHDGLADNAAYRHDRRADNAAYRHDRRADSLSRNSLLKNIPEFHFYAVSCQKLSSVYSNQNFMKETRIESFLFTNLCLHPCENTVPVNIA